MFSHIADALAVPDIVRLEAGLYVVRFESMKVTSALAAVRRLMAEGVIRPGDTLVDSSSGVYAYGLALACKRYGFECRIIASPAVDATLKTQLELLGAVVDQPGSSPDAKLDQAGRVELAVEFVKNHPRAHWMRQYHDQGHYDGYAPVARQLAEGLGTERLTLVGGVGTGASTGGLHRGLTELGVQTELIGVQPFGSVSFASQAVEDPEFLIAGIGSGIPFGNIAYEAYREIHWMDFTYARSGCIELLREHCVFAGLSSGAAYVVARWHAQRRAQSTEHPVVFIAPDTGHRYLNEVFAGPAPVVERDEQQYPRRVTTPGELGLPWCVTDWQQHRAGFPCPGGEG
ncbi:Cysteine synthase [Kitasatospora sp. MMS16-BH015]|uniref:pyridoxal-phosphate dependent enzyme n=1 Tax=Kitasatospora sp. MMS16-BH015 TaxID=2018025 RepID=UPI000CA1BA42|nr:pyridoxal-phosphate dependent enzyme [Kitasatospora sp. MMS16-BH015]AUG78801.1 Cysteine synthase [Kitasatospora sp. MMS16-BH015]